MTSRGQAVIGLDAGTTSVKAGLYLPDGREHTIAARRVPLETPGPGWAEQDPDTIVHAALEVLAEIAHASRGAGLTIAGICTGTAMHGLVGLDADGRPLTALLTYADTRARHQADVLRAEHPDVYRRTGTPLHPMAPLAKLRWMHDERPEVAARVRTWVTGKEYLLTALTGRTVIDQSSASATGLWSLVTGAWDPGACELAGVDADHLAEIVATDAVVGGLTADVTRRTGIAQGTQVIAGATDGVLANIGVGALGDGVGAVTIGTSGAVRVMVDHPVTDDRMRVFCYALAADRWVVGGAISNGGLWVRWLREQVFADDLDDEAVVALAADVPAGSDGMLVLPYLTGERAPAWSTALSGVIFGARYGHGRGHLVRAGLEGVGHQLRLVTDALDACDLPIDTLRASGGFTRSALWTRIVCDILDIPLDVVGVREASAFGAAALGMVALGLLDDLDGVVALVETTGRQQPDDRSRGVHDDAHARYTALVEALAEPFARLATARKAR